MDIDSQLGVLQPGLQSRILALSSVKIGLTRRLDPMDRVREVGDASVPFRFDVHAIIFSEDAVG